MINKLWLILLPLLFLSGLLILVLGRNESEDKFHSNQSTHPLVFFDKDTFYPGVERVKKENKAFTDHASGGIIPHDLLPGFIITDFFGRLSKQQPKTIILIGPNHYERGDYRAVSSLYGWETPFGTVEPESEIIGELVTDQLVKIDEQVLAGDHSAAGIMPFIKYYLPDTKVVPILLSGFMTEGEAGVMKNFAYRQLFSLNNDYLDSPPSIATLLMTMQTLGATKMELLYHTNSGQIQKNDSIETTSYFSVIYY